MKNLFESMLIAFSMYSKIPMPKVEWNDKNMKYAMCFFPVIGVVIGVCVQIIGTLLIKSTFGSMLVYNFKNAISLFVAGALFFQYYKRLCKKQFGGITGDLAGYFLQVFELLMLGVIVLGTRLYALV